MSFIDPFELLGITPQPGQPLAPEELRRAKRKLLTEFELAGTVTIDYRGQALDKATALAAVEQLEDPLRQSLMAQLHLRPELLHVLRTGELRALLTLPPPERLGNREFLKFASSLLAPSFADLLGQNVRRSDWATAGRLLSRLDLIDEWDRSTALKGLVSHTRMLMGHVQEATDAQRQLAGWDEPAVFAQGLMTTLNRLPADHQHLRNQYGAALEKLAIALTEQTDRHQLAHQVITAAASLTMDANIAERIRHNQLWIWGRLRASQAKATAGGGTTSGSSGGSGGGNSGSSTGSQARERSRGNYSTARSNAGCMLWLIFPAIFLILRLIFLGSSSSPSSSQFDLYKLPTIPYSAPKLDFDTSILGLQRRLDSISKSLYDSLPSLSASSKPGRRSADQLRYDTIMFRDLVLYDELNVAAGDGVGGFAPQTGQDLYAEVLRPKGGAWAKREDKNPLRLSNLSDHDAVFFFETMSGGQVYRSYYVPAGEAYVAEDADATFIKIRVYHGKNLKSGAFRYRGEWLPAFASEAPKMDERQDSDAKDFPNVEMIFNFPQTDYSTKKVIMKTMVLDSDYVLKKAE